MPRNSPPLIIKFTYEHLRNEAHVELHAMFNTLVAGYSPETLGIQPLYSEYKRLYDEEVTALDVIRKSVHTYTIKTLDRERNELYRGFAGQVKANLLHFDRNRRKAAQQLRNILQHYGYVACKGLIEKTAALTALHRDLLLPENAAPVTAFGLDEWLEKLAQANSRLEELVMTRNKESAKRNTIRMRHARRQVDRAFRTLLDLLEALVYVHGKDTNKAFRAKLNVLMKYYKDALAQEAGRRRKIER